MILSAATSRPVPTDHYSLSELLHVYGGRHVIKPQELSPLDSEHVSIPYGNEAREPVQRFRDLLKLWQVKTDGKVVYAIALGSEVQAEVNYAMPVKNGMYDFMYYAGQVREAAASYRKKMRKGENVSGAEFLSGFRKTDRLIPVITLTVHFGPETWDGPLGIREMMNTQDPVILRYIPDYKINLISPSMLSEEELRRFATDFGLVMEYIKFSNDKSALERITSEGERYRNLEVSTANLINAATGGKLQIEEKEGHVDMRNAIDEIREDSYKEGCEMGRKEGRQAGLKEGHTEGMEENCLANIKSIMEKLAYTSKQAMDLLNIPEADQEKYLSRL